MRRKRVRPSLVLLASIATFVAPLEALEGEPEYTIETIAGNGQEGDLPGGGGAALEVPVDLPFGLATGPDGALYITCVGSHRVLRLDRKTRRLTSVAGSGRKGYSGDGGPATAATLNEPYEVRFDSRGNMLVLEMQNHLLRRVDAKSGLISTVAGDGTAGYEGDGGPAAKARFRNPHSLLVDAADNVYVSDLDNHRVRKIDSRTGRITSLVGNGKTGLPEDGSLASDQPFTTPQGLALRDGKLWISSPSGQSVWRLDVQSGKIYRAAGTGKQGHTGDGGDPLRATFDGPRGVWLTSAGVLCVAEGENNVIRAFDTGRNTIRTIAGAGPKQDRYAGDGVPAVKAPISQPHGVLEIEDGQLLISDTRNHRVRLLKPFLRGQ
jgi:DNA-binding beta-propeller fold protein YncE